MSRSFKVFNERPGPLIPSLLIDSLGDLCCVLDLVSDPWRFSGSHGSEEAEPEHQHETERCDAEAAWRRQEQNADSLRGRRNILTTGAPFFP